MAKTSVVARNLKRERLVSKYAEKRKALKKAGDWKALDKLRKTLHPCAFATGARLPEDPEGISGFSGCRESNSVNWQTMAKFLE